MVFNRGGSRVGAMRVCHRILKLRVRFRWWPIEFRATWWQAGEPSTEQRAVHVEFMRALMFKADRRAKGAQFAKITVQRSQQSKGQKFVVQSSRMQALQNPQSNSNKGQHRRRWQNHSKQHK